MNFKFGPSNIVEEYFKCPTFGNKNENENKINKYEYLYSIYESSIGYENKIDPRRLRHFL